MSDLEKRFEAISRGFTNDDWLTPIDVLQKFGRFDLDPCMSVMQPWQTADRCYTVLDNGLVQPWSGRVWLNPPYSSMDEWILKMVNHIQSNGSGMGLYNARTETQWFFNGVWTLADSVFFPKSRFKFFRPDGTIAMTGKIGSVIAAYSEQDSQLLYGAELEGKFICLRFKLLRDIRSTWKRVVRAAMQDVGGVVTTEQLYELVSNHPKAKTNLHWKAKVRQQLHHNAQRVGDSQWQLPLQ